MQGNKIKEDWGGKAKIGGGNGKVINDGLYINGIDKLISQFMYT
ncbi:unnamed protein product [marine sediment metagenome]|uniref:Uncharacterized protein n=1 Tax=marine sediment metagenome TaxID=412755 RepID=X0WVI9_9ZZZZ